MDGSSMVVNPGLVVASNKAIIQAQRAIQLASLFTTDFSPELKGETESVSVDVYSGNASTFDASSNDYENTDGKIIPVKVALDTVIKATFKISQKDLNQIDKSSKYRNCGVAAGRMISDALEKKISDLLTYTSREDAITGFTIAAMGKKVLAGIAEKYNPATCNVILTPEYYGALLDEAKDKGVLNGPNFAEVAQALGRLYGVKSIFMLTKVSDLSASNTHKCAGYVVPEDAVVIAARGIEEAVEGTYQSFTTESDPDSGLPVTSFIHGSPSKNTAFLNSASQIGVKLTKESPTIDGVATPNGAPGYLQLVTA